VHTFLYKLKTPLLPVWTWVLWYILNIRIYQMVRSIKNIICMHSRRQALT